MLDLDALLGEMGTLAEEVVQSAQRAAGQRDAALEQLERCADLPSLREAVLKFKQDMALPVEGRPMDRTYSAPPAEDYTIIATDGSQVAPDYHHIASWYVINAGCAVFRYGAPEGRERCRLSSHPALKPPSRSVAPEGDAPNAPDGWAAAASLPPNIELERLKAELELGLKLLEQEADPGRTVLLLDGPLIQWRMLQDVQRQDREDLIALFQELLGKAQATRTPIAGYISRSRAVEWVTLLRFSLCPDVAQHGELCARCKDSLLKKYTEPLPKDHHAPLLGLRDVQLAAQLLPRAGSRTEVIELRSEPWTKLSGGGRAGFFYFNAGPEIGRVELPAWVWEDEELLERLHAALWDQCESGRGYPMVLSEAHEMAVVRAADRDSFYLAIERILNRRGLDSAVTSAKAASKRRPLA